jgi:hypothetical protein
MFRVPAVPIIRSTILQLAVTGITYITLDREMYGNVHFKDCPDSGGWSHHRGWFKNSTMVCDQLPSSEKVTLPYISWSNIIYVIPVTANCSIALLMMGTAGIRNMYISCNETKICWLHLWTYNMLIYVKPGQSRPWTWHDPPSLLPDHRLWAKGSARYITTRTELGG